MEQFTVYVDETIPMVITDDDVTKWQTKRQIICANGHANIIQTIFVAQLNLFLQDSLKTFAMINQVALRKKSLKSIIWNIRMKV